MPRWLILLCFKRFCLEVNYILHRSHWKMLMWLIFLSLTKASWSENDLLHLSHWTLFFSRMRSMFIFRFTFWANVFPQSLHLWFSTPEWTVFLWRIFLRKCPNSLSHKSHLCFFPKWELCLWFVRSIFFPNFLSHKSHRYLFLQDFSCCWL